MKKLFGRLKRGPSPSRGPGASPKPSPKLGGARADAGEFVIGYEINKDKDLPKLHKAAWNGDVNKVRQLVKKDPSAQDKEHRTPLHLACARGHVDVVKELLEWKAKTNVGDNEAKTPLLKAVECKQEGCLRLLLENKSEVDACDTDGNSGLHYAVRYGYHNIVILLIKGGAKLDRKNMACVAPLHVAAIEKREQIMRTLLAEGCDVNICDDGNKTPLMHACDLGCINQVKMLIQCGADSFLTDKRGWTAEDYAMIKAHHGCSQLVYDNNLKLSKGGNNVPSLQSTPRDTDSPILGLTAQQDIDSDNSDDEAEVSRRSMGEKGNDSWGEDTDISLAVDDKKVKESPKISLAKFVNTHDSGEDSQKSTEKEKQSPEVKRKIPQKRDSGKSLQSEISIEDSTWSVGSDSPGAAKKSTSSLRVSFKPDKDLSEIHDITADEESELDIEAKKPRLSPKHELEGKSIDINYGDGEAFQTKQDLTPEQHKAIMAELGLSEADDITDPDFSMSEISVPDLPKDTLQHATPSHDQNMTSSQQRILKASKQEEEWDTDTEDAVKPEIPPVHPKIPPSSKTSYPLPNKTQQLSASVSSAQFASTKTSKTYSGSKYSASMGPVLKTVLSDFSDDDDDDDDDGFDIKIKKTKPSVCQPVVLPLSEPSEPVSPPLREPSEPVSPPLREPSEPVSPPLREPSPVPKKSKEAEMTDDDSNWDSEAEMMSDKTAAYLDGKHPVVDSGEEEDEDSEEEIDESISEWEIERQKQKEVKMQEEELTRRSILKEEKQMREEEQQTRLEEQNQRELVQQEIEDERQRQLEKEEEMQKQRKLQKEQRILQEEREEIERKAEMVKEQINVRQRQRQSQIEGEMQRQKEEDLRRETIDQNLFQQQIFQEQRREEERLLAETIDRQIMWEAEEKRREEQMKKEVEFLKKEEESPIYSDSDEEVGEEVGLDIDMALQPFPDIQPESSQIKPVDHLLNVSDFLKTKQSIQIFDEGPVDILMEQAVMEDSYHYDHIDTANGHTVMYGAGLVENTEQMLEPSTFLTQHTKSNRDGLPNDGSENEKDEHLSPPPLPPQPPPDFDSRIPQIETREISRQPLNSKKIMSVQSDGLDDDDFSDVDSPRQQRHDMTSYLAPLYGPCRGPSGLDMPVDDDGLSLTSTENGDSLAYLPSLTPYSKDILMNLNLNDPSSVIKVQDQLRENRKQLDQERGHTTILENKQKALAKEKNVLQKKVDTVSQQKSKLEQLKLDLEANIRSLDYSLNEEVEKRKNAEILLGKTKEQLSRKEEQYTGEIEAKQRAELALRRLELELRTAGAALKEIEDEKAELVKQVYHEKDCRQKQEQLSVEHQRLHEQLQRDTIRSASQKTDAEAKLDELDEDRRHAHGNADKLRAELYAIKMELDRQRTRFKDENALFSAENEELQIKVDELKNDIKLNEEALAHASVQYNLQLGGVRSECSLLSSTLEKERAGREKSETELNSLRNRMNGAALELEKTQQVRNELERRIQQEREECLIQMETKDDNMAAVKENNQELLQKFSASESKVTSLENELHLSNTTLLERSNKLQKLLQELQFFKSAHENTDQNNRMEKDQNVKLQSKVESLQEKLSMVQHESLSLRQQLDTAQSAISDRSGHDSQERFAAMFASLKTENEQSRIMMEDKNSSLNETTSRLREDIRVSEGRRTSLEQDLHRLNQDHTELIRKLSVAEATMSIANQMKDQLETEKGQLKIELDNLRKRYETANEKAIESNVRISDLTERLEKTEQDNLQKSQQLANTSSNLQLFSKTKEELEGAIQSLQVENVKLDAELKHEKQRSDMLNRDLQDSQKVRSSLEALCSNLKSTTAHLEEKLGSEHDGTVGMENGEEQEMRKMLIKETEENKDLWEKEVVSRSKLGMRIAQMEKHKQSETGYLEKERHEARKAIEAKREAEIKLEAEQEKSSQLQKEVANLRAHLKFAKKRLKNLDVNDARLGNLNSDFDKERVAMEDALSTVRIQHRMDAGQIDLDQAKKELEAGFRLELNRKLDEVNVYLEEQARARDKLDQSRDDIEKKIKGAKRKLEEENGELRIKYEQALAQKETKELEAKRYRDLYESEMQWRQRISDQLQSSTDKAFNYKSKLVSDHQRGRVLNSFGNLSFSGSAGGAVLNNTTDPLTNKIRMELERSIAKHMEAAPHDSFKPMMHTTDDMLMESSLNKSSNDYIEVLRRKYCI